MAHSIPDAFAVAITTELGTMLMTGDYKFDQTPVDGVPADVSRLAELGREGLLLLCGDSTNADRPGMSLSESAVGPRLQEVFARCKGPDRRHLLRLEHPPRAAGGRRRGSARPARVADRPLDAQEHEHRADARPHRHPRGDARGPKEIEDFPDNKLVIISTGSQGEPLSALRRMAHGDHPNVDLHDGDTVIFSATPIPGNERAVNETIDRIYRLGATRLTTADVPVHASGHGYAEELKLMVNLTRPRYVMPVHGDHKRLRLHGELAEAVGVPPEVDLPRRERPAARDRLLRRALGRARAGRPDLRRRGGGGRHRGRGAARPPDALGGRHLHRGGHDLRAGRPLRRPARDHLPRRALRGGVGLLRRRAARGGRRLARRTRRRTRSPRSTSCRTTSTTTWPSSSTSA